MDSLSFFRLWLSDPLRIGAVAPSSQALAAAITAEISPEIAPVIELGPGSGAFTRALLERGIPQRQLALIEQSEKLAFELRRRFPAVRVLCADAAAMDCTDVFHGTEAGAVVSGLPLLLMSPGKVGAILANAFAHLRPGGAFYQFTYGARSPVPRPILDRLGLTATRIGGTLINIPPATVYRIARRRAEQSPAIQLKSSPASSERFGHSAAPYSLHAVEWTAFIKESFHGIRTFLERFKRAILQGERNGRR